MDQFEQGNCWFYRHHHERSPTYSMTTEEYIVLTTQLTHKAIAKLVELGMVKLVVSTNIDGLHMRSGIPLENVSSKCDHHLTWSWPNCMVTSFLNTVTLAKKP